MHCCNVNAVYTDSGQPVLEFPCCLCCMGQGKDLVGSGFLAVSEGGDSGDEGTRFTCSGSGDDGQGTEGGIDAPLLFWVELHTGHGVGRTLSDKHDHELPRLYGF